MFMEELMGVFFFSLVLGNASESINSECGLKKKATGETGLYSFVL